MAILQTKYVDVGVYTIYGTVLTGFISTGTVSNTQNGSSDVNLDSVFSGADITSFYHSSTSGQGLSFSLSGNRANGTFDTLKIGGVSFARTSATHSYNSSNNRTTWTWSSVSSSPFGTTVGADKQVTWETAGSTVTAPVISGVSNNNAAAASVTATISLSSSGSGGTLQYAQTTSNSAPSSGWSAAPAFSHPRGTTRYYWARRDTNTVTSSVSHSVGYLTGDTGFSRSSPTIAHNAPSATTTIQYATAGETLAIRLNGQSTNLVTAVVASSTQSQNITFSGSLPSAGSSSTYRFFVRRPTSTGGDGSTFVDTGLTFTVTRNAADTTPNAFSFTDKTGNASTEQNSYAQITGINAAATVSRTSGGATFAVASTSTTPSSSNFGTSNTTITNNQYLHVKQTTSSTYNATLSTVMNVGGVTDTWVVTTNPAPSDGTPENYSFTDVTTALSTVAYAATQITGISQTITVSRTSGAAVFAISNSGTTTPTSSAFTSSNKTLTNNQYIWLRQTSSSSNSTTLTSQFSAGGVSASWNLTTVAASGSSGTGFGLRLFPPTGTIARLDTTDRTARVLAVFTGTLAAGGSSSTFTQPGYSSSDITIAVEWQTSGDPQYVSLSSSGTSLTVTRANDPSSFSNNYQVRIFRV